MVHSARGFLLALGLGASFVGCDLDEVAAAGGGRRHTEEFQKSFTLNAGGRLELESFNGAVELIGWDRNQVEINGTKFASTEAGLKLIKVEFSSSPDSLFIRTERPQQRGGWKRINLGATYRIHVPRQVLLERITTSNGAVRIQGVQGRCRVKTSNGAVRLLDLAGEASVETSNGRIELERYAGNADLHTSNGAIAVRASEGSFSAESSNGSIEIEAEKADATRPLRASTSNGPIRLRLGGGSSTPEVRANTSNGQVTIHLPGGANARVRAATSNSDITSDFALNNVVKQSKTRLEGTIGSGGPLLDLASSNGAIRVLRY